MHWKILESKKFLLVSFIATGFFMLVGESLGKETAKIFSDAIFIPIPATLVILSIIFTKRHGIQGMHGKAWMFFLIFVICWFVAEQIWTIDELVYHTKPFPSEADLFYIAGYPAYAVFSIFYIKPFEKSISKKMVFLSSLIAVSTVIPNLYMSFDNNSDENQFAIIVGAIYPVLDGIILVPSLLGVMLFLRGKVNFFWSTMLIAILFNVGADSAFQYFSLDDSYYTGHPVDIIFLWSYLLFAFGVYNYISIFKKQDKLSF